MKGDLGSKPKGKNLQERRLEDLKMIQGRKNNRSIFRVRSSPSHEYCLTRVHSGPKLVESSRRDLFVPGVPRAPLSPVITGTNLKLHRRH